MLISGGVKHLVSCSRGTDLKSNPRESFRAGLDVHFHQQSCQTTGACF